MNNDEEEYDPEEEEVVLSPNDARENEILNN